jgi:hypothetical protein
MGIIRKAITLYAARRALFAIRRSFPQLKMEFFFGENIDYSLFNRNENAMNTQRCFLLIAFCYSLLITHHSLLLLPAFSELRHHPGIIMRCNDLQFFFQGG